MGSGIAAAGCTFTPYDQQHIGSQSSPLPVSGWTIGSADKIAVQCFDLVQGQYATITTLTADTTPQVLPQGTIYQFTGSTIVPDHCWLFGTALLQFIGTNNNNAIYAVFDSSGASCVYAHLSTGGSMYDARETCRLKNSSGQNRNNLTIHSP
jgi:hypothetical protein